jgi:hypothetical protein
MEESFLHFIWKYKLYNQQNLATTDDEPVVIINSGIHNRDAGPDFTNAKVKIGNTIWAGNIEIHLRSSDWQKHNHSQNGAYNNVILHVVYENDTSIYNNHGEKIPVVELQFDKSIFEKYTYLQITKESIGCSNYLHQIDKLFINNWIDRLSAERLEKKSREIQNRWERNNKDIEQTFFEQLAISFGLKSNSDPFEQLARHIPLKILNHHSDSLFQIESLMFGVAGFLDKITFNRYHENLAKEYNHLCNKYQLIKLEKHQWKFLRMRPSNFPTIRIAQFASVIKNNHALFSKILNSNNTEEIKNYFSKATSEFWETHYTFEKESPKRIKKLGELTIRNIIINTVAPFLFFYGNIKQQQKHRDKALSILQETNVELNKITKLWRQYGIEVNNAAESQALIQLYNMYCIPRKCLDCQIGSYILSKSN